METFEQKITKTVSEKMNDGTIERLVEEHLEKAVSEDLKSIFSYSGAGRKLIEGKLEGIVVQAIEAHDFNKYLTKMDSVLAEIVNMTNLADNKEILENFKELMEEPEAKEINLSEIFKQYCRFVAEAVDTGKLEACCEDGDPYYEHVTAQMETEHEKSWSKNPTFNDCIVRFSCDEDESLNCQLKLYKRPSGDRWSILRHGDSVNISSLLGLSSFDIFLMNLNRAYAKIIMDEESDYDDDIEPVEAPEWTLK